MESPKDIFKDYSILIEILESAKLATDDIDTLGDIEERIKEKKQEQSKFALSLILGYREKGTIQ
jgi:hypothetical protein